MCHQAASPHHYTDNSHTWGSGRWCDYESPVRCWPGQMMSMVTQSVVIESKNIEDCQHCNVNCWKKIYNKWGRLTVWHWSILRKGYFIWRHDEGQETGDVPDEAANASWHLFFVCWLIGASPGQSWDLVSVMRDHVMSWGDMIQPDMGSEIIYTLGQEMQANLTNWDLSLSLTYHHLTIITMSMSASLFKLLLNAGMCP